MVDNFFLLFWTIVVVVLISEGNVCGMRTWKMNSGLITGQKDRFHRKLTVGAISDESIDPIDPLEDLQEKARIKFQPKKRKAETLTPPKLDTIGQSETEWSSKPKKNKGFRAASNSKYGEDDITLDQKILLSQAEILRTLPLDYFLSFRNICEQLVPRFGIYSLTFHVILLIPIIRIVKFQLNASVYPFLYIGPALFLVPYLFFWLWENDVCEVPIFDSRLLQYVQKQKTSAMNILQKERPQLMNSARNGGDQEAIKKIANLTLMSDIDIEYFMSEILAIKKRIKGRSNKNPTLSTFSQDNNAVSEQQVNFNDDVNSAVKTLIENSLLGEGNESEQSLLDKLKQLEKDLDNSK